MADLTSSVICRKADGTFSLSAGTKCNDACSGTCDKVVTVLDRRTIDALQTADTKARINEILSDAFDRVVVRNKVS